MNALISFLKLKLYEKGFRAFKYSIVKTRPVSVSNGYLTIPLSWRRWFYSGEKLAFSVMNGGCQLYRLLTTLNFRSFPVSSVLRYFVKTRKTRTLCLLKRSIWRQSREKVKDIAREKYISIKLEESQAQIKISRVFYIRW